MTAFITFIISLVLLVLLFVMKSMEIYHGRKVFLEKQFENFDAWIAGLLLKIKFWWSHVNFKNANLIFSWLVASIRMLVIRVKRRFDHEQAYFFTKREPNVIKGKGSASFFLKNVSEYKKNLPEGRIEK
jgi:hypothetical protein